MATLKRYTGSSWVTVPNGTAVKYYSGGWQNPDHLKYYDGSNWQIAWSKSDPEVYYFEATATNSYRYSGWRGSNDLRVGSFADSGRPAGYGDHVGVISFHGATDTLGSGKTIAQALQERPNCSSATVVLKRRSGTGFSTTGTGNTWYTGHTSNLGSGTVGMSTTYQVPTTGTAVNGPDTWTGGGQSIFNVSTSLAEQLQSFYLYVSNTTSLSSTGGYDDDYSALDGHSDTDPPQLRVTLDY